MRLPSLSLRALAIGIGAGIVAVLLAIGWQALPRDAPKSKPWNRDAVIAEYVRQEASAEDRFVIIFVYAVTNRTSEDYRLPSSSDSAYVVASPGNALALSPDLEWPRDKYIPPNQRVNLELRLAFDYTDSFTHEQAMALDATSTGRFWNGRLSDVGGFRILDRERRYQIDFPKGWTPVGKDPPP